MEAPTHRLNNLFAQLGLASDDPAIEQFIKTHRPLTTGLVLSGAPFWTSAMYRKHNPLFSQWSADRSPAL